MPALTRDADIHAKRRPLERWISRCFRQRCCSRASIAGGVTAGIDFALPVIAALIDEETAQGDQLTLEYAPAPPFDAGRPETAPPGVRERVVAGMADMQEARWRQAKCLAERL